MHPRDPNFKLTFSLDVRGVNRNDVKGIANYLTSYVTKNDGEFKCQIWNCSKKISWLKTNLYEDGRFLKKVEALEKANLLGGERKTYQQEYHVTHTIPLNKRTLKLYNPIDEANKEMWHQELKTEKL